MTDFSVSSIPSINAISLGDSQADDATAPQTADQATEATQSHTDGTVHDVIIVGSGPAGLACAQQLTRAGAPA